MDLLSVGLETEDKGSGKTVGKGLGVELNKGRTTGSSFAELGAAPCVALDAALGDAVGAAPGAVDVASDGAVGMVLGSIEIEEGRLLIPTD